MLPCITPRVTAATSSSYTAMAMSGLAEIIRARLDGNVGARCIVLLQNIIMTKSHYQRRINYSESKKSYGGFNMTKKKKITTKKGIETSQKEQLQKKDEISMKVQPTREADSKISLKSSFPIVGIGASAGGLAAFEAFFSGMPTKRDPGMAFVLVQHLAPDHKSILVELVRRYTRMEVYEVEDGMAVRPNCTYIIPPNRDMAFLNGALQLLEQTSPRGMRLPIEFFFRSLAQDQRERAICIVLSGPGSG